MPDVQGVERQRRSHTTRFDHALVTAQRICCLVPRNCASINHLNEKVAVLSVAAQAATGAIGSLQN